MKDETGKEPGQGEGRPRTSAAPEGRESREGREPRAGGESREFREGGRDRGDREGWREGREGGREGGRGRRGRFRGRGRRKVCRFCADKALHIDYKWSDLLEDFVSERGRIVPSRTTGTCARHQRRLKAAIKQARNVALLPYARA